VRWAIKHEGQAVSPSKRYDSKVLSKILSHFFIVVGLFYAGLTFASLLNSFYWLFDVLTHFNLQYALALMVCLVMVLVLRPNSRYALLFASALLVNAYFLSPFFWPRSSPSPSGNALHIVSLNVLMDNQEYQKVSSYLREASVDVVFLSEIEPELMNMLGQELADIYPYVYDESMEGAHGLAMMSKQPFVQTETIPLDERHHRFLTAEITWQGQLVKIYAAHPHPPLSPFWTKSRDDEIRVIREAIALETNAHIFLGDFNASPWSNPMRQLFAQTRLRHAAKGFGIYPTWRYKTMLLGVPLDHILVSDEWQVASYTLGRDVGSDHFPVIAELHLK
jgi:endonuclease/exonuclease/phosphatase (EEP) superfamily protein YafD